MLFHNCKSCSRKAHGILLLQIKRSIMHSVVKNMHYSIKPEAIKIENKKPGYMATNICIVKQCRTKLAITMFFVERKPAPKNIPIQCRVYTKVHSRIELSKHKGDGAQRAKCHRYGHNRNYCCVKLRWAKCAGDHLTNQCHRQVLVISDVSTVVEVTLRITMEVSLQRVTKGNIFTPQF